MIEVFKTNVQNELQVKIVFFLIKKEYGAVEINVDLEDCDRVLRIKGEKLCKSEIINILRSNGFECFLLD